MHPLISRAPTRPDAHAQSPPHVGDLGLRTQLAAGLIDRRERCLVLGADRKPVGEPGTLHSPLRLDLSEAVRRAAPGFTPTGRPAPDVLAIDVDPTDRPHDARRADTLLQELASAGYVPLVIESGRPGHAHLWCVIEDRRELSRFRTLASTLGLSDRSTQHMRLPLAPYYDDSGQVRLLSPETPEAALRAVRRTQAQPNPHAVEAPRPLPQGHDELLRTGLGPLTRAKANGEPDRSFTVARLAFAAVNAGWTEDQFVRVLLNPVNLGGVKAQVHRDPLGYLSREYLKAQSKIASSPPVAGGKQAALAAERWLQAVHAHAWSPQSRSSTSVVAAAFAAISTEAGRLDPDASLRRLQERSGITSFSTLTGAIRRLEDAGYVTKAAKYSLAQDRQKPGKTSTRWSLRTPTEVNKTLATRSTSVLWGGVQACAPPSPYPGIHHDVWQPKALGRGCLRVVTVLDDVEPLTVPEIASAARYSDQDTVRRHLRRLRSHGLAKEANGGWVRLPADLDQLAADLGTAGANQRLRARNEQHRQLRRQALGQTTVDPATGELLNPVPAPRPVTDP